MRLFASRADDRRQGGDVDLHIEAPAELATFHNEIELEARLQRMLGERRPTRNPSRGGQGRKGAPSPDRDGLKGTLVTPLFRERKPSGEPSEFAPFGLCPPAGWTPDSHEYYPGDTHPAETPR